MLSWRGASLPDVSSGNSLMGAQESRLRAGGLPDSSLRRLEELRGGGLASSFLGAAAFSVGVSEGVEPVGQVVGGSVCRLAVGVVRRTRGPSGRLPMGSATWREHEGPIRSWTTARKRALARLSEQARLLGAHGVLGVSVQRRVSEGEPSRVEMVFTGTAVRIEQPDPGWEAAPVLGLVSVREFCLLRRTGVLVVGIAGACSSVEVGLGWQAQRAMRGWRGGSVNRELDSWTKGVYEARRLAVDRLRSDATALGCDGVIGVDLAGALDNPDMRSGPTDSTVHLLGTAVRRRARTRLAAELVVGIGD